MNRSTHSLKHTHTHTHTPRFLFLSHHTKHILNSHVPTAPPGNLTITGATVYLQNSTINLTCNAIRGPTNYAWKIEGGGFSMQLPTNPLTLTIAAVSPNITATCIATNPSGSTNFSTTVSVCVNCAAGYQPSTNFSRVNGSSNSSSSSISSVGCTSCSPCLNGTYKSSAGRDACVLCPYPFVTAGEGAASCVCPVGQSLTNFYLNNIFISSLCTACPIGTYKDVASNSSCLPCPPNTYSDVRGSPSCLACPANAVSLEGSTSLSNCTCDSHSYMSTTKECVACPRGTVCPSTTAACNASSDCVCDLGMYYALVRRCLPCDYGYYKDTVGNSALCTPCPFQQTTTIQGAVSVRNCECPAGTYLYLGYCGA